METEEEKDNGDIKKMEKKKGQENAGRTRYREKIVSYDYEEDEKMTRRREDD